jgi:hypothetical protein
MKDYKDLTLEERELWDAGYSAGHDAGYDEGFDNGIEAEPQDEAYEAGEEAGFKSGFEQGVEKERERVQFILNMMFESSLNMGKGQRAVFYREVMELLKPADIKEYYPEDDDF